MTRRRHPLVLLAALLVYLGWLSFLACVAWTG